VSQESRSPEPTEPTGAPRPAAPPSAPLGAAEATALMARVKRGERAAFDELVLRLRSRAFHVAQGLVGSRDDALELSQEALLKIYRARETYREGEPFLPWFQRILRNTCFSFLREQGRLELRSLSSAGSAAAGEGDEGEDWDLADPRGEPPAEGLERAERAELFWKAFAALRPQDREILALRHFDDLAYQEIAETLSIPVGTVMSRLFHARRRLREGLEPLLGDAGEPKGPLRGATEKSRGGE
jgi:RNA polymerase sigma-70 factor (ECF subfamily)